VKNINVRSAGPSKLKTIKERRHEVAWIHARIEDCRISKQAIN